jgi:hypothetical protein
MDDTVSNEGIVECSLIALGVRYSSTLPRLTTLYPFHLRFASSRAQSQGEDTVTNAIIGKFDVPDRRWLTKHQRQTIAYGKRPGRQSLLNDIPGSHDYHSLLDPETTPPPLPHSHTPFFIARLHRLSLIPHDPPLLPSLRTLLS